MTETSPFDPLILCGHRCLGPHSRHSIATQIELVLLFPYQQLVILNKGPVAPFDFATTTRQIHEFLGF